MAPPLDPAFQKLLADPRVELTRPPPGGIERMRAAANAFLARAPRPPIHSTTDIEIETKAGAMRLRLYRPAPAACLPLILFIHGGGFVLGNLESHDAMARALANRSGVMVAAIDYRLAPEHPFPAALDDCGEALAWLIAAAASLEIDVGRLALAGDSAGGQLAVATALRSADAGIDIRHLGLLYPLLDPHRRSNSARAFGTGYMLSGSFLDYAWVSYAGESPRSDPLFDLNRSSVHALPPTTLITAEYDPLRDEGQAFAERLRLAGVPVESVCFPGVIHGFAGLPQLTLKAEEAIGLLAGRIGAALADQPPG